MNDVDHPGFLALSTAYTDGFSGHIETRSFSARTSIMNDVGHPWFLAFRTAYRFLFFGKVATRMFSARTFLIRHLINYMR